jgi:surface carbohydrate biosynthesis protein
MARPATKPGVSVGYIVDHPKRDLPGGVQFARAMLERGGEAYIIPMYDQAVDVPLLSLDAIVVNFARPANLDLVRAYHSMGIPVFVLDTEGGILTAAGSNTPERLASLLRERGFPHLLSGYFFWGPALRDVFAASSGMRPDQLHTTGCPRFDYASPRWRAALRGPAEPYVLVNANFVLVNPRFSGSEAKERESMIRAGWMPDYVDRLLAQLQDAFHRFVATVRRFAQARPERRFLVRPHPFEGRSYYDEQLSGLPNVVVSGKGDVLSVLARAECLLHLNCGTAVEALMLSRLPISLEFLNSSTLRDHAPLPFRISEGAMDEDRLLWLLDNVNQASSAFDFEGRYREYVYPWFYENDGRAADRMAEVFTERLIPRPRRAMIAGSLRASRQAPRVRHVLQGLAGNAVGTLAVSRARALASPKRRDKAIDVPHLRRELSGLCGSIGLGAPSVEHAAHPLTGIPLASVRCAAG